MQNLQRIMCSPRKARPYYATTIKESQRNLTRRGWTAEMHRLVEWTVHWSCQPLSSLLSSLSHSKRKVWAWSYFSQSLIIVITILLYHHKKRHCDRLLIIDSYERHNLDIDRHVFNWLLKVAMHRLTEQHEAMRQSKAVAGCLMER